MKAYAPVTEVERWGITERYLCFDILNDVLDKR